MDLLPEDLGVTFQVDTGSYDSVRPEYPPELLDDIVDGLPQGARGLDAGCGSGQVTIPLARRGYQMVGLDISTGLLDIARRKAEDEGLDARFDKSGFEEAPYARGHFDFVSAIASFHWFDQHRAHRKAGYMIRPGGRIALAWSFPSQEPGELAAFMRSLYRAHCPDYNVAPRDRFIQAQGKRIGQTGLFEDPTITTYERQLELPRDRFLELVGTYSWVKNAPDEARRKIKAAVEARIPESETVILPFRPTLIRATRNNVSYSP